MVERNRYEVVVAEFGLMGQYLNRNPFMPAVRKVVSVHHCHTIAARQAVDLYGYSPRAFVAWLNYRRMRTFEFSMYHCADHMLVLTPEEKYGVLNYDPDLKISVIPSGVDTDFFQPPPEHGEEKALVFTGYYDDAPNREAVLWFCHAVWPRLRRKHPDLSFYVVGPSPPSAFKDIARRDPGVRITGWVDDIRPYLARAQVFVCPNRTGSGMRGKILQAMAMGTPVVATSLGAEGIPIEMGNTGFLADRPDILAQYIDLLLTDSVLRESIGKASRQMVVDRFAWDRSIILLEAVLQDAVAGR